MDFRLSKEEQLSCCEDIGEMMYRDEDHFVLGQKIKLALIGILLFIVWAANGFHLRGMLK